MGVKRKKGRKCSRNREEKTKPRKKERVGERKKEKEGKSRMRKFQNSDEKYYNSHNTDGEKTEKREKGMKIERTKQKC